MVEDAVLELIDLVLMGVESGPEGQHTFLTIDDLDDAGDLDDSRSGR